MHILAINTAVSYLPMPEVLVVMEDGIQWHSQDFLGAGCVSQ